MKAVCDNVVSGDVTITSSLRDNIRNKFYIFFKKTVLRMIHAKNYEAVSTFFEVMQKKNCGPFFPDTV